MHIRLRIAGPPPGQRQGPGRLRPLAFFASLAAHGAAFAFLLTPGNAPDEPQRVFHSTLVSLERDHKIIWYQFKKQLPEVSPANPTPQPEKTPAAEQKAAQKIVTAPTADPGKQFVWIPAPQIKLKTELNAPNLIALQPPLAPPAPVRPPAKAFQAPEVPKPAPTPAPTPLPSAPSIALNDTQKDSASLFNKPMAPPRRDFTPPPQATTVPHPGGTEALPSAPAIEPGRGPATVSAAILGLNPTNVPQLPVPDGGRAARINAGPETGPGTPQLAKGNAPIALPDVSIEGKPGVAAPAATRSLNSPSPNTPGLGKVQLPAAQPAIFDRTSHVSAPQWPSSRSLPGFIERRFHTRVVYTTLLPSEQNGEDWVVWFAEETPTPPDTRLLMRPPSVLHGAPLPAVPAKEDHGTGKLLITGVLKKDGHFGSFNDAPPAGAPQELLDALQSWQFNPAMRNGVAVDVEAVMEIPLVYVAASLR